MIKKFSLALPAIILSTLIVVVFVLAWTEPTSPPPEGNVPAPLNTGDTAQTKTGTLRLGGLRTDSETWLATESGNVGIGMTSPSTTLDVNGTTTIRGGIMVKDSSSALDSLLSGGIIKEKFLPYCKQEITSDVYTNGQDQTTGCNFGGYTGYYDISNLTPESVKKGVSFGRGQTGNAETITIGGYTKIRTCLAAGGCSDWCILGTSCESYPCFNQYADCSVGYQSSRPVIYTYTDNRVHSYIACYTGSDCTGDGVPVRTYSTYVSSPLQKGDITSDWETNTYDTGFYDVSNLTPENVRKDVVFGRGGVGTLSPAGYTKARTCLFGISSWCTDWCTIGTNCNKFEWYGFYPSCPAGYQVSTYVMIDTFEGKTTILTRAACCSGFKTGPCEYLIPQEVLGQLE